MASSAKRASARLALARDAQARRLLGARVPIAEQRSPIGVQERLQVDALLHTPRGMLAHERNVLAADLPRRGERVAQDLGRRGGQRQDVIEQLAIRAPVDRHLGDDPLDHRLGDLGVTGNQRSPDAADRLLMAQQPTP